MSFRPKVTQQISENHNSNLSCVLLSHYTKNKREKLRNRFDGSVQLPDIWIKAVVKLVNEGRACR